ncbi:hypothetical protein [Dokdonia sp. Hel_I_53]|uniref:hypothetical protein n=1 Tax=Dokdonia sp. Hel_I_53 TaxID=1566287 RepID=UPI001199E1A3|nr:hypothetical protein [Dokdonia sp. Hel_I_53]TVZ53187.1 hypothetical protein OD90_2386 [Dokdonia sp. Hel_I_53]
MRLTEPQITVYLGKTITDPQVKQISKMPHSLYAVACCASFKKKLNYTFNEIEKDIIQRLKNSEPKRIWTEFIKVIFEFDEYYVELECVPEIASSQNKADEAMTLKVREFKKSYLPYKNAKVIVENKPITDIKSVRTLLYFTDTITEPEKVDSKWNRMLSKIAGIRKSEIEKLLDGTTSSYHDEIICKPNSDEAKKVNGEFSNLIDVGIILEIGKKYLPAFVQGNGYGFAHLERKLLLTSEELKEELTEYELK